MWMSTDVKVMPIMGTDLVLPMSLFRAHEDQAHRNHGGQSLERLAERGGLAPFEALAILEDHPLTPRSAAIGDNETALVRLEQISGLAHAERHRTAQP
jgi:hypothetical protein